MHHVLNVYSVQLFTKTSISTLSGKKTNPLDVVQEKCQI